MNRLQRTRENGLEQVEAVQITADDGATVVTRLAADAPRPGARARPRRRAASRAWPAAAAARRCPGKLPGHDRPRRGRRRSPRGCRSGTAIVSATNGKTTTAALVAAILSPRVRLAHNSSGANLVSGSRLHPARRARRRARPVRGRRGRVSGRRAAGPAAGGLPRQPLPRPARPLRRARADRRALARPRSRRCPSGSTLVVNADDPQVGDLARERAGQRHLRPRRSRAGPPVAPARRRLEVLPALRHAVRLRRRLRRASRRLPLPRRAATAGPRSSVAARAVELDGLEAARSTSSRRRARGGSGSRFPASTTSTTRWPPRRSRARWERASTRSRPGSPAPAGVRPLRADRRRRPARCCCS